MHKNALVFRKSLKIRRNVGGSVSEPPLAGGDPRIVELLLP